MTSMKITSAAIVGLTALIATAVIVVGVTRHGAPKTPALITSVAENTDQPKPHTRPADPDVPGFNQEPPLHSALRIARLKHAGDWNLAPRAIPNLMEAIRKPPVSSAIALTEKDLFPRDPTLIYYPLLYIHGRGSFSFPREDLEAIRRHLDPGGGTLLADADCGSPAFDAAFRRFVVDLLPQRPLEPIPPDDEIFTDKVGFDLRDCQYTRAAGGVRGFPQLEGVRINGHWGIIYSKFDLGCALDRRRAGEDWTGYTYDSAFKIVGNVLIYLTLP